MVAWFKPLPVAILLLLLLIPELMWFASISVQPVQLISAIQYAKLLLSAIQIHVRAYLRHGLMAWFRAQLIQFSLPALTARLVPITGGALAMERIITDRT